MTEKKEATTAPQTQKILSRAAGLDDLQNGLVAYVGTTGKARQVSWLVYMEANELDKTLLGFPPYVTVTVEAGANLNDF